MLPRLLDGTLRTLLAPLLLFAATGCGGEADTPASSASDESEGEPFSFFVTSYAALQRLSGSQQGFGGDLRFGETGPGAGLRGADKICSTIAESSLPGAGSKVWRAFLSATDDGEGSPVNAIDRIGTGPWYDRAGRLFGNAIADINADRPTAADPAIANDFPNEDGVPNHQPDPALPAVDNHDMLTGSNLTGELYSDTATCLDWTSALGDLELEGKPRVGHSWPRMMGDKNEGDKNEGAAGAGNEDHPDDDGSNPDKGSGDNWMSALIESGCAPGVNLVDGGGPVETEVTVGSGGGYGGFYCFALTP